jgi:hypothetical protein
VAIAGFSGFSCSVIEVVEEVIESTSLSVSGDVGVVEGGTVVVAILSHSVSMGGLREVGGSAIDDIAGVGSFSG